MTRDGVGGVCETDEITTVGPAVPQTLNPLAHSRLSFKGRNCSASGTLGECLKKRAACGARVKRLRLEKCGAGEECAAELQGIDVTAELK